MKLNKLFLTMIGMSAAVISACGQYTNFPAQYHYTGTSDLVATISYDTSVAKNATVKLPKLVLKGEPGSIGVTFENMSVNYNTGDISPANIPVSFRVDSSNFRDAAGNVIADGGTFNLPIINSRVIELGKRLTPSNLNATITLTGTDDANWPTSMVINTPIVFLPGTGSGSSTPVTAPTTP